MFNKDKWTAVMKRAYGINSEKIGEVNAAHLNKPPTELRKRNRIKTIQAYVKKHV